MKRTFILLMAILLMQTTVLAQETADQPSAARQAGPLYDDLLIGIPYEDIGSEVNAGAVHRAAGAASGFATTIAQELNFGNSGGSAEAGDEFGRTIATGDFNGDGYTDVAIGIPNYDDFVSNSGAVIVRYGESDGSISTTSGALITPRTNGFETFEGAFGRALTAGDFNGDGLDDLVVGHPNYKYVENNGTEHFLAGYVHIYHGLPAPALISQSANSTLHKADIVPFGAFADRSNVRFGEVLTSGDYNGDGFDDLIVGVPHDTNDVPANSGSIMGRYGTAQGLGFGANIYINQNTSGVAGSASEAEDNFGFAVASGDFNGDGFDDVAVGIAGEDVDSTVDAGAVAIFNGSIGGVLETTTIRFEDFASGGVIEAGDKFGYTLAAGDVDNDGYDDLVFGMPFEDTPVVDAGKIVFIKGSGSGIDFSSAFHANQTNHVSDSSETDDRFGWTITIGDFNGDYFDDVAVGSPYEQIESTEDAGDVRVLSGSAAGLNTPNFITLIQGQADTGGNLEAFDRTGYSLATMERCTDHLEPNNTGATAIALEIGRYKQLRICPNEVDVYKITLPDQHSIDIKAFFTHEHGDIDLKLYADSNIDGTVIASGESTSDDEVFSYTNTSGATMTVHLKAYTFGSDLSNQYELQIDKRAPGCLDDHFEPNDSPDNARKIEVGETIGLRQCDNDADTYWFMADAGEYIQLESLFTHVNGSSGSDVDLGLRNADYEILAESESSTDNEYIVLQAPYSGVYYVDSYLGFGTTAADYSLKLTLSASIPTVVALSGQSAINAQMWQMAIVFVGMSLLTLAVTRQYFYQHVALRNG